MSSDNVRTWRRPCVHVKQANPEDESLAEGDPYRLENGHASQENPEARNQGPLPMKIVRALMRARDGLFDDSAEESSGEDGHEDLRRHRRGDWGKTSRGKGGDVAVDGCSETRMSEGFEGAGSSGDGRLLDAAVLLKEALELVKESICELSRNQK